MWFLFALCTTVAWGASDLFYKKGADASDRYSHLKTAMIVGFVMGLHAVLTLCVTGMPYDPVNLLLHLPVSLLYILSMTVGYFGLRYLQLSVSSPVQNSSGAVTCILCLLLLGQSMDALSAVGVALICAGVFALGLLERKSEARVIVAAERKYAFSFTAFLLPVAYCVIDALGTFFDAYYLDSVETTPLSGVTADTLENTANVSYELTFLLCAVLILLYLLLVRRERIAIRAQRDRGIAALLETAGQATYVYALSGNGAVAAPLIASYSIVSLLLSRIFLKEKLGVWEYAVIAAVIAGVALLGLAEGLAG